MANTEPTSPSVKSKPTSVKPSKTGTAAQTPSPPTEPAPQPPSKPQATGGGFKKFLYNKEEGSCLGRTGLSWLKIMIFYIIFYFALGAFFVALLFIAIYNFPKDIPFADKDSTLNKVPGLGFRPVPKQSGSALIYFDNEKYDTFKEFVKNLNNITQADTNGTYNNCTQGNPLKAKDVMCKTYSPFQWGPCTLKDEFGYRNGTPCVLIRLNKIIGWEPDKFGENLGKMGYKTMPNNTAQTKFCISCKGDSAYAEQHIGRIEYYPKDDGKRNGPCITSEYFPYKNQKKTKKSGPYLAPYIFAYFPELPKKIHLQVVCQAYNNAIPKDHDSTKKGFGVARFELLVGNGNVNDFTTK